MPDPADDTLAALPALPRDEGGPAFAEPWQAQAFALDRGEPDDGSQYYHHWQAALERLVLENGLLDSSALTRHKDEWADAYRHTPHGKPVKLADVPARGDEEESNGQ